MRAARYYGREDLRLEDVPVPEVGAGDVKIRVRYAGICGTDLHEYYLGPLLTCADQRHSFSGVKNPVILGHELSGEVVETGPGVTTVSAGDHVVIHGVETCQQCDACRRGRGRCRQYAIHGYTRDGGAFSEFTVVKERMAYRVPDGVPPVQAALIEPMGVGMTAAIRADVHPGETAALHGCGPIGIGILLALRAQGVEVIVSDPSPVRRETARGLGAVLVLDPDSDDVVDAIRAHTGGLGAATSLEAAGVGDAVNAAIQGTAEERRVVVVSMPTETIELDVARFHAAKVFLTPSTGTTSVPESFKRVMELMVDGRYPYEAWTETVAFESVINEGFEPLHRREKVKVLLDLDR